MKGDTQLPMYIFDSHPTQKLPIFNQREILGCQSLTSTHLKSLANLKKLISWGNLSANAQSLIPLWGSLTLSLRLLSVHLLAVSFTNLLRPSIAQLPKTQSEYQTKLSVHPWRRKSVSYFNPLLWTFQLSLFHHPEKSPHPVYPCFPLGPNSPQEIFTVETLSSLQLLLSSTFFKNIILLPGTQQHWWGQQ